MGRKPLERGDLVPYSGLTQAKESQLPKQDVLKQISKATPRRFSAEEKIRIVLEGLRGQISVAELCRRVPPPSSKLA